MLFGVVHGVFCFVLFGCGVGGEEERERDRDQGEDSRTGGGEVGGRLGGGWREVGGVAFGEPARKMGGERAKGREEEAMLGHIWANR